MTDKRPEESKSYSDPLGDAGFTALLDLPDKPQKPEPEEEVEDIDYPAVESCYRGFYQRFLANSEDGRLFLLGVEGIVGSRINTRALAGERELLALDERVVGRVAGPEIRELNELESQGWQVECRLVFSIYHSDDKRFSGEVAWFAYDSQTEAEWQAFANFIEGIAFRISFGMHPGLNLDQQQFQRVLKSHGQWDQTKDVPPEPLPAGALIHKRSRNLSDRLVHSALEHRLGCNIATWIFLAAILLLVIFLFVWFVWPAWSD